MTTSARIAIVVWMLALTFGLLAGQWPLQGPQLFGARSHGVHAGDVPVLAVTVIAAITVLNPTWPGRR